TRRAKIAVRRVDRRGACAADDQIPAAGHLYGVTDRVADRGWGAGAQMFFGVEAAADRTRPVRMPALQVGFGDTVIPCDDVGLTARKLPGHWSGTAKTGEPEPRAFRSARQDGGVARQAERLVFRLG